MYGCTHTHPHPHTLIYETKKDEESRRISS